MFKVMYKLKSDKKGFTLTELLVTMTIMLIALTLTVQLMSTIWQNYQLVEYRWIIQTAVEYVAACFTQEAHNEAFATADRANLFHDAIPTITTGTSTFYLPSVPELGALTYNADEKTLKVDPTGVADSVRSILQKKCIYFITVCDHFYIIRYDDIMSWEKNDEDEWVFSYNSKTFNSLTDTIDLIEKDKADIRISIDFSVAGDVLPYSTTNHGESKPGDTVNGEQVQYEKYIPTAITANIKGTIQDANLEYVHSSTEFSESISMLNMVNKEMVNYTDGKLTSRYVSGWNKGNSLMGFPSSDVTADGASAQALTSTANIVRYHSVNTKQEFSVEAVSQAMNINVELPVCFFNSISIGLPDRQKVLQPIRDFRDNVLRGNWIGDKIIDIYYNDFSPIGNKVVSDIPILRALMQEITVDLSSTLALIE